MKINGSSGSSISTCFMDLDIDLHKGYTNVHFCIHIFTSTSYYYLSYYSFLLDYGGILLWPWCRFSQLVMLRILYICLLEKYMSVLFEKVRFRPINGWGIGNCFGAGTQGLTHASEMLLSWAMYLAHIAHFLLSEVSF